MRAPEEYRAARAAASHWLQLRITTVKAPQTMPGVCIVRGERYAVVARQVELIAKPGATATFTGKE